MGILDINIVTTMDRFITMQLEDMYKKDLLLKNGDVTKKWIARVVLDGHDRMMVTFT